MTTPCHTFSTTTQAGTTDETCVPSLPVKGTHRRQGGSLATVDDIKNQAKLFDYGNDINAKQITDDEINAILINVEIQIITWLESLKYDINNISYYVKRYIVLETIVALALSNYRGDKDYIDSLKLERDKYFMLIEKNTKLLSGQIKRVPPPKYAGNLYD